MALAERIDLKKAKFYFEFYLLILAALRKNEIRYFNDVLIEGIDHLLSAADIRTPIEMQQSDESTKI